MHVFALLLVLAAAVSDIRYRVIPNWMTYTGVLAGIALGYYFVGYSGVMASLIGLFLALLPAMVLFIMNSMGGGDVKLLSAMGALLGYPLVLDVWFFSILAGSALSLVMLVWRGELLRLMQMVFIPRHRRKTKSEMSLASIPFAVAIAFGTVWTLFSPLFSLSSVLEPLSRGV